MTGESEGRSRSQSRPTLFYYEQLRWGRRYYKKQRYITLGKQSLFDTDGMRLTLNKCAYTKYVNRKPVEVSKSGSNVISQLKQQHFVLAAAEQSSISLTSQTELP